MRLIDEKDFSEDTAYNLPGGKISVFQPDNNNSYDLIMILAYSSYSIMLGYKLGDDFKMLSFGSHNLITPIDALECLNAEVLIRLLAPSLKIYAQNIINTLPTTKSNIIIGYN